MVGFLGTPPLFILVTQDIVAGERRHTEGTPLSFRVCMGEAQ